MTPEQLAASLATEEGLTLFRALQSAGAFGRAEQPAPTDGPQSILDWEPREEEGELVFLRKQGLRGKPKRLPAEHPDTFRVCLFGESLAAGFPLAPAYTPSTVLEVLLAQSCGSAAPPGLRVEVIDLALPNMGPSEQLRVCEAASQLQPDLCVFLTGNNWYYGLSLEPGASPEARVRYAQRLERGEAPALARAFRKALLARAEVMTRSLIEYARAGGAQALVVIPASNLEWERRAPVPWLEGGAQARWHHQLQRAEDALAAGDYEVARTAAEEMATMDTNTTGVPERVLARVHEGLGDHVAAREARLLALEPANWQNVCWALPVVSPSMAEVMRSAAEDAAAPCIDLAEVIASRSATGRSGFDLFYDQCHLNVEGIQLAMEAVAAKIRTLSSGAASRDLGGAASSEDPPRAPAPRPIIAASGALQAAHWVSRFEPQARPDALCARLVILLQEAMDHSPLALEALRGWLELRSLDAPPDLNAALARAACIPGLAGLLRDPRLNAPLFKASLEALEARDCAEIEQILSRAIGSYERRFHEGLELSSALFRDCFWERTPEGERDSDRQHSEPIYRALWPVSRFSFLCSGEAPLRVRAVARAAHTGASLSMKVNGEGPVLSQALTGAWQRWEARLEPLALRRGLNTLSLEWAPPSLPGEVPLEAARRRFAMGAEAEVFPTFGELYSLRLVRDQGADRPRSAEDAGRRSR
ncbi:MAG: hypothetical protein VXZ39_14815 [Planctomycetota bacterium]|nr:hypothetical protein [Planctomycetota bacterium]